MEEAHACERSAPVGTGGEGTRGRDGRGGGGEQTFRGTDCHGFQSNRRTKRTAKEAALINHKRSSGGYIPSYPSFSTRRGRGAVSSHLVGGAPTYPHLPQTSIMKRWQGVRSSRQARTHFCWGTKILSQAVWSRRKTYSITVRTWVHCY